MNHPPRPWRHSSRDCAPHELLLSGSPRLALLLAAHMIGLPVALLASNLTHAALAALACALLALAAARAGSRLLLCRGAAAARRLRFSDEGRFLLDLAGGRTQVLMLQPRSLVAGPWLLLVFSGGGGEQRVLIDRSRVEPARFAALVRCLRRAAASPAGTRRALISRIDPLIEP